jgi:hypothetical protein
MRTIELIIELTGGWDRLRVRPLKIEAPHLMPLTIEFVGRGPVGGMMIAISHTYKENGDVMMDPEILAETGPDSSGWLPVSFRQDNIGVYQEAVTIDCGKVVYDHRLVEDLRDFMRCWDANLRRQGFVEATRRAVARESGSAGQVE